ncbi:retrovirus-related Pol polyprotein from type-2 retrotransposable element R2DM [Trichonephila inaurata madagascariensis]|uniref:Retrovirus-related Pol polyprotein from type-2 retrotransposable element R2DM n=1 Tax=Trichonephila inaurata madagascariensis TaxID=2747483 RepID=A0A8X6WYD6_9ARAC|nr:retrovirus-related Pol polyprotein from type-2 retrotransposable element R2DM [Trichonephila inaurata madagascariensis]
MAKRNPPPSQGPQSPPTNQDENATSTSAQSQVKTSSRREKSTKQAEPEGPPSVDMTELLDIPDMQTRTVVRSPTPTSPHNQLLKPNNLNENVQLLGQTVRFTFPLQKITCSVVNSSARVLQPVATSTCDTIFHTFQGTGYQRSTEGAEYVQVEQEEVCERHCDDDSQRCKISKDRNPPYRPPVLEFLTLKIVAASLRAAENSAPGLDLISYKHWREIDPSCKILTRIFNICLKIADTPDVWKTSRTILIHKGDSPEQIENWRPISLSDTAYKLFMKCVARGLAVWCDVHEVLSTAQKRLLAPRRGTGAQLPPQPTSRGGAEEPPKSVPRLA